MAINVPASRKSLTLRYNSFWHRRTLPSSESIYKQFGTINMEGPMSSYWPGIALIILGVLIFLFGKRSNRSSVQASHGSVAVGGQNNGTIQNTNISHSAASHGAGGHGITILAIGVELIGIGVTIWHAWHLAHR
jgi:hypothetical protein